MMVAPPARVFDAYSWKECLMSLISLKKSRCSASIFKIMLYRGLKFKKLFVYSHASEMKYSESPTRRLPWIDDKIPPTEMVGSVWAARRISLIMDVVVVLPCVPATAIE